jgi:hypothetical protein
MPLELLTMRTDGVVSSGYGLGEYPTPHDFYQRSSVAAR